MSVGRRTDTGSGSRSWWRWTVGDSRVARVPRSLGSQAVRDHVTTHRMPLLGLGVVLAAVLGLVFGAAVGLGWHGFVLGLLVGLVAGVMFSSVLWFIVEVSGARSYAIGGVAEAWTADALARLGPHWRRVHALPIGKVYDIDHVLVGPPGVFAVETKFTAMTWDFRPDRLGPMEAHALEGAARSAIKVRNILHEASRPVVTPLLVVWGPGAAKLPPWQYVGHTLVCAGRLAPDWLAFLANKNSVLVPAQIQQMVRVAEDHIARTEAGPARSRIAGI
jgi:hypothetical protein